MPAPCLSVEQQIAVHAGYEPRDIDRDDLATLAELTAGIVPSCEPIDP